MKKCQKRIFTNYLYNGPEGRPVAGRREFVNTQIQISRPTYVR
jgi:hypothetical protein